MVHGSGIDRHAQGRDLPRLRLLQLRTRRLLQLAPVTPVEVRNWVLERPPRNCAAPGMPNQVKNWKRGLRDRLKKYLAANGGWRNADIFAFIQSDCNYAVYCANRLEYEEDCRRNKKPVVRRVREDKFCSAAIAIQRCSLPGLSYGS